MEKTQEKILYNGGPSQRLNLGIFALCAILFMAALVAPMIWDRLLVQYWIQYKPVYMVIAKVMLVLPWFWAGRAWLLVYCHKYKITSERLMESEGIFSRTTSQLELFRVRDITFHEPFIMRVLGCGDIILDTSDKSTPIVVLHAIREPHEVLDLLRRNVVAMRAKKGVREVEI